MTRTRISDLRITRQVGKTAAAEAELERSRAVAEQELQERVPTGWSRERLAFAMDLYAGVPRRVWGYDCCSWCGREGHGHGHLVMPAACAVRTRIRDRARAEATAAEWQAEAEAIDRYEAALAAGLGEYEARGEGWPSAVVTPACDPEGVPCPPFEELRLEVVEPELSREQAAY